MARDWEQTFRDWAKPSSDTEQAKCENAERMIREAIADNRALAKLNVEVFAQGSYKNNTNVRLDSDVDICVCCYDVIFPDFSFAQDFTEADVGLPDAPFTYTQFKNEVEKALVAKFGRGVVSRGGKAFDVHENSFRVDADVVPCFEHRRYTSQTSDGRYLYTSGTEFPSNGGGRIINWPAQNYQNGVAKNQATGNRFKYITRVLKRLRNELADNGVNEAAPIPSYLIECLVWNVPNDGFGHKKYSHDVRYALAYTFNETMNGENCKEWGEVNDLKYLFWIGQPWARTQVNAFLDAAWNYIGFE